MFRKYASKTSPSPFSTRLRFDVEYTGVTSVSCNKTSNNLVNVNEWISKVRICILGLSQITLLRTTIKYICCNWQTIPDITNDSLRAQKQNEKKISSKFPMALEWTWNGRAHQSSTNSQHAIRLSGLNAVYHIWGLNLMWYISFLVKSLTGCWFYLNA